MITEAELLQIDARLAAVSGVRWEPARAENGIPVVCVELRDGRRQQLSITREREPASAHDVEFIAHARGDVERLAAVIRSERSISETALNEIEGSLRSSEPGALKAFLEADGGTGGSNVIWVSERDDEPDLYLWFGPEPALDADFEFVAAARQDIPRLWRQLGVGLRRELSHRECVRCILRSGAS